MKEGLGDLAGQTELLAGVDLAQEIDSATRALQEDFDGAYNAFFHNQDPEARKRLGMRILSSLDYVLPAATEREIARSRGRLVLHLPYKPIVDHFEVRLQAERDSTFAPIRITQPSNDLPRIPSGGYSARMSLFLNRKLYLIRRSFVLNPDGNIQRGVEQIIAAQNAEQDPLGEIWIGKKWLNSVTAESGVRIQTKALVVG